MQNQQNKKIIPPKNLIWGVVIISALLIFKNEIKEVLIKSEEISIFGVSIKSNKNEIEKLTKAVKSYEVKIIEFSNKQDQLKSKISNLEKIQDSLEADLIKCPNLSENSNLLNTEIKSISKSNVDLNLQLKKILDVKIIKKLK